VLRRSAQRREQRREVVDGKNTLPRLALERDAAGVLSPAQCVNADADGLRDLSDAQVLSHGPNLPAGPGIA
jgi:hypothetical protein